jgi:group I intron endonuclease
MGIIYEILHLETGRCYVGSSVSYAARWRTHRHDLRKGRHHSPALQDAWNRYGEDAFVFHVLEHCADDQLILRERFWGARLDCCFNLVPPGSKGGPKPADFAKTMSLATKGKPRTDPQKRQSDAARAIGQANSPAFKPGYSGAFGRKDSDETIEKRRQSRLATEAARRERGEVRTITEDHKRAIGRAASGRRGEKRTVEAKANMSASATSAWSDPAKRAAMLNARRSFRWMTNGEIDRKLFWGDELPEGWMMGRHHKGTET